MRDYKKTWVTEVKLTAIRQLILAHNKRANCYERLNQIQEELDAATMYQNLMMARRDEALKDLIKADKGIDFFERKVAQAENKLR